MNCWLFLSDLLYSYHWVIICYHYSIVFPLIYKFCLDLDENEGDRENSKQIKILSLKAIKKIAILSKY